MGVAEKIDRKYTYQDYLTWPDEERWEIIDGTAYNMTPAPGFKHTRIAGLFFRILENKLQGSPCIASIAPTDIILSEHDIVQPDVFVICDKKMIIDDKIHGAPVLVIEILSPSTAVRDRKEKKTLYEKSGVKEYILIDPIENYAERFVLRDGKYGASEIFGPQDALQLISLEGVAIPLGEIFQETVGFT